MGIKNISIRKAAETVKAAINAQSGVGARVTVVDGMAMVYGKGFTFTISPCRQRPQGVDVHIVEGGDSVYRLYGIAVAAIEEAAAS